MKHLLTISIILSSCVPLNTGNNPLAQMTLEENLKNPLFAEEYSKTMVDVLTELEIDKNPLLEDKSIKKIVEEEKNKWQKSDRSSRKLQNQGIIGQFVKVNEHSAGEALLIQNFLFLGTDFITMPGPELHIYLTEAVDPRDTEFPDASSVDLGKLSSPLGAQNYSFPSVVNLEKLKTVVLWDKKLKRIHGFAQLSK